MSHNKPSCTLPPLSRGCLSWTKKMKLNQAFTQQIAKPRGTRDRSAHAPFMNHWFTLAFPNQMVRCHNKKMNVLTKTVVSIQKLCVCNSFSHLVRTLLWHHQGDLIYCSMAADIVGTFDTTKVDAWRAQEREQSTCFTAFAPRGNIKVQLLPED